jgi:hypothetical protein
VRVVQVRQRVAPTRAAGAGTYRSPADMLRFTAAVWRESPDVFFSPSVYTYFPVPPGSGRWSPSTTPSPSGIRTLTLPDAAFPPVLADEGAAGVRQARLVLTVSDYAARELRTCWACPPARIRVAVEAPSAAYTPERIAAEIAPRRHAWACPRERAGSSTSAASTRTSAWTASSRAHARLLSERPDRQCTCCWSVPRRATTSTANSHIRAPLRSWAPPISCTGRASWPTTSCGTCTPAPGAAAAVGIGGLRSAGDRGGGVRRARSLRRVRVRCPELLEGGGIFIPPGDEDALTAAMLAMASDEEQRRRYAARAQERARSLDWAASGRAAMSALREAGA